MFFRRHHCLIAGTPVTLSNGMSRKIEDICEGQYLPSWNPQRNNIDCNEGKVNTLFDQGFQPCLKLVLEDGREIIATSDHKLLAVLDQELPKYVMMKDLTNSHKIVCSVFEGVLDDPSTDNYDYLIPGTNFSIHRDREKCLVFARLCGYSLTDGNVSIDSNRIVYIMGDIDDSESICKDIEMLLGIKIERPTLTDTGKATIYRVEFRSPELKKLFVDVGVTIGNKVDQGMKLPNFMWDEKCPLSIKREFIAGWFGGDGSKFGRANDGKSLKTNSHLVSVSLQGPNASSVFKSALSAANHMNNIINGFGVKSDLIINGSKATLKGLNTINSNSPQQLRVVKTDNGFIIAYDTTTMILDILYKNSSGLTYDEICYEIQKELVKSKEDISTYKSSITKSMNNNQQLFYSTDKKCIFENGKIVTKKVDVKYFISESGLGRLKLVKKFVDDANNPTSGIIPRITCRIGFNINIENLFKFNQIIGFRYCIDKQSKMTVGSTYENYRKRLANQRIKLINIALDKFLTDNPQYADPRSQDKNFSQKLPKYSEYISALAESSEYGIKHNFDPAIIINTNYKGFDKIVSGDRRTYEAAVGKILASCNTLSLDDFIKNSGFDWEAPSRYGKRYFTLRILDLPVLYKNGEPQKVYDISVPGNTSFIANGIVSHNCRNCGDVFCGTCSNYWNTIPDCITHIPTITGIKADIDRTVPMRLCKPCDDKIRLIKKLEILLKSVQIVEMDIFTFKTNKDTSDLSDSFIKKVNSIPDINNMTETDVVEFAKNFMNGKLWKQLSNFYLSKFREIQYKLPYQDYSEWEKNALWTNYKYLRGHDIWMVHTIRAFAQDKQKLKTVIKYFFDNNDIDDVIIKDRDECWDRMCTRMCQQKLSWENSLLLLDIKSKTLMKELVKSFSRCDDETLENILPVLTHKLIYDTSDNMNILMDFVIQRCSSKRIANKVYWSFVVEKPNKSSVCDYLISKLFRSLDSNIYEGIMKVNNFVKTIEENHSVNEISNLDKIKVCVSPTKPELGEQTVCGETFPGEISANRPIPIILSPGCELENVILYKSEDLRTDLIVMSIIRLMKNIIEEVLKIDLHVVTYDIQPTSLNTGFIGAVGKSQTLYKIEETLQLTLANYIKKNNPDISAKELSERFSRSCAFYSVMTFLLGIGDRHLDNIMLTERGELFHIDYGFILGKDPRPMKSPYMRISEGMLDAIGGYHSEEYVQFKDLCYQIYDISRRHVNTFVALLSLLPKQNVGGTWTNPKISDSRVLREIVKRFAPGETYEKAKSILDTRIDKSTNMTNRSKYHIVDFFHRHNKEGTIRNIVSTTVGYGLSGTTNLISGIWDYVSSTLT